MLLDTENKCDNCEHKYVCSFKDNRDTLADTVRRNVSEPRFENFKVEIRCVYFLRDTPTIRSDICP